MYLASVPTKTKASLPLSLLSLYLSPTLEQPLAQLAGKLAYLLLEDIGVPLPGSFFPQFLPQGLA
jgi:hypothetical protein